MMGVCFGGLGTQTKRMGGSNDLDGRISGRWLPCYGMTRWEL